MKTLKCKQKVCLLSLSEIEFLAPVSSIHEGLCYELGVFFIDSEEYKKIANVNPRYGKYIPLGNTSTAYIIKHVLEGGFIISEYSGILPNECIDILSDENEDKSQYSVYKLTKTGDNNPPFIDLNILEKMNDYFSRLLRNRLGRSNKKLFL